MKFPTMWYVRPAMPQISLRICAVWSEPLLVVWIFYQYLATGQTVFWVSKLKRRLHRLVWVYTCQNATLLEITCHRSYIYICVYVWSLTMSYKMVQFLLNWSLSSYCRKKFQFDHKTRSFHIDLLTIYVADSTSAMTENLFDMTPTSSNPSLT